MTPILNSKNDVLQELYGEFFIAELVAAQNDEMKAFVLESSDSSKAVGFMNVTTNFDCECLNRQHDLKAFNYLRKQADEGKLEHKDDVELQDQNRGNWIRRHLKRHLDTDFTQKLSKMLFCHENNNAVVIQLYGLLPQYDHRLVLVFILRPLSYLIHLSIILNFIRLVYCSTLKLNILLRVRTFLFVFISF